ncbi:YDG/SRA domain-containing protein [Alteromonas sp. CYL-A6]|uniref:YDG/SRA domain-containing protein n=1 Tax=Alteromonas nitratireducens TaxID=3390813 RepID=UPI0034AD6F7A
MRTFGHIKGVEPGEWFANRKELAKAGVHSPLQAGISGSQNEGADSIVLSGGYEDDEDLGDVIVYTGAGGQDADKRIQVAHQELTRTNLALAKSKLLRLPVRVIRGHEHKHELSPQKGYVYAGLYEVEDYWSEIGKSGYVVWRYRLVALDALSGTGENDKGAGEGKVDRRPSLINRLVRNSSLAQKVKDIYNYECQVCGVAIKTSAGLYAEAAHIKPLGQPHNGPDTLDNLLCLCPNHHVMFDNGALSLNEDLSLMGEPGKLRVSTRHLICIDYVNYHREHYSKA